MAAIERCKEFMTNGTFNMVRKATGHNTTVTPWVGFCGVGAFGRRHKPGTYCMFTHKKAVRFP